MEFFQYLRHPQLVDVYTYVTDGLDACQSLVESAVVFPTALPIDSPAVAECVEEDVVMLLSHEYSLRSEARPFLDKFANPMGRQHFDAVVSLDGFAKLTGPSWLAVAMKIINATATCIAGHFWTVTVADCPWLMDDDVIWPEDREAAWRRWKAGIPLGNQASGHKSTPQDNIEMNVLELLGCSKRWPPFAAELVEQVPEIDASTFTARIEAEVAAIDADLGSDDFRERSDISPSSNGHANGKPHLEAQDASVELWRERLRKVAEAAKISIPKGKVLKLVEVLLFARIPQDERSLLASPAWKGDRRARSTVASTLTNTRKFLRKLYPKIKDPIPQAEGYDGAWEMHTTVKNDLLGRLNVD